MHVFERQPGAGLCADRRWGASAASQCRSAAASGASARTAARAATATAPRRRTGLKLTSLGQRSEQTDGQGDDNPARRDIGEYAQIAVGREEKRDQKRANPIG